MGRNIGNVVNSINELVSELGLEKLSAAADDPGTAHPAKQEAGKANIQAATEGARSAENTKDNKAEVTGQSVAEAKPADAKKDEAESSAKNLTTATFVGEDAKVEKGYGTTVTDPGTSHPAKADEKTAADLNKCAEAILAECAKLADSVIASPAEAREKLAKLVKESGVKDVTADTVTTDYLTGYVKSAGLVGELTADMLDGMAVGMAQAEKEAQEKAAEGEMVGPEEMDPGAMAGGEEGGGDADAGADALAQAAVEIAAELGCEPEDVLDAAAAELEGGEGGGEDMGGGEEMGGEELPPEAMEAMASDESEEVQALREKSAKYDALVAKQAAEANEKKHETIVKTAVSSALENWMAQNKPAAK